MDPERGERLSRSIERKSLLLDKNVYGERFTERQFDIVFDPLLRFCLREGTDIGASGRQGPYGCIAGSKTFHGQGQRSSII